MLAWIPFVQPAPGVAHLWWLLVVPLSILLSMIWRAIRTVNLADYWPSVARMSAQIVLGMVEATADEKKAQIDALNKRKEQVAMRIAPGLN